jgi:hypothetical protein
MKRFVFVLVAIFVVAMIVPNAAMAGGGGGDNNQGGNAGGNVGGAVEEVVRLRTDVTRLKAENVELRAALAELEQRMKAIHILSTLPARKKSPVVLSAEDHKREAQYIWRDLQSKARLTKDYRLEVKHWEESRRLSHEKWYQRCQEVRRTEEKRMKEWISACRKIRERSSEEALPGLPAPMSTPPSPPSYPYPIQFFRSVGEGEIKVRLQKIDEHLQKAGIDREAIGLTKKSLAEVMAEILPD